MRRVHNGLLALTAAIAFSFAGVACNTTEGVKQDANEATQDAKDTSDAAKAEAKEEGKEAKDDVARTGSEAASALDAATETIDVKTALMSDSTVDASDINVDTFHETKTVVLKGSVATAAQKSEAAKIAAREAEGYKVENQLVVRPRQ